MRARKLLALILAIALAGAGVAACGGGSGGGPSEGRPPAPEQAFLQSMVPHHDSAVEMAKVAGAEATTPFVKRLAADIERSQTSEIAQMRRIHERLFGSRPRPPALRLRHRLNLLRGPESQRDVRGRGTRGRAVPICPAGRSGVA